MKVPEFAMVQTGRSAALAFHFRSAPAAPSIFGSGWALCTLNNRTGELTVCSDWGDWTHRWNVDHLGSPSLLHFIGDRTRGSHSYIAEKLCKRQEREQFSPEKTVAEWRRCILERRREGWRLMPREVARQLWDELGEIEREDDVRDFVDAFYKIDHSELIFSDGPSEHLRYESTSAYLVLLHSIIPALVGACTAELRKLEAAGSFWRSG